MRVLVTGGSGLVGRHVVRHLAARHAVKVLDVRPPADPNLPFIQADIREFDEISPQFSDFEAVVHLAAIPNPVGHNPQEIFETNVTGTVNVAEAAARAGLKRFVFASSESVLGFAFMQNFFWPEFLPIDESHSCQPQDAYGVSKLVGEEILRSYCRHHAMVVRALRPPWVWVPEEAAQHRRLIEAPEEWFQGLWAYIWVDDLAAAMALALEDRHAQRFEACFVSAPDNGTRIETRHLLGRFYPQVTRVAPTLAGRAALISSARAEEVLGWKAKYSWQELPHLKEAGRG